MAAKNNEPTPSQIAAEKLLADLAHLGNIHLKKMFGGHGVFEEGKMFALVNKGGVVHFKVDDANRLQYEAAGSVPHGRMPYYQVPDAVLTDEEKLSAWALTSIALSKK